MKKITIGSKPQGSNTQLSADAWVSDRQAAERMKRLTIDVSERLHVRVKTQCAMRGVNMADEIRTLLETHFPEPSQ
jgi:hypothetical protein